MDTARKTNDFSPTFIQSVIVLLIITAITRTIFAGATLGVIINKQVNLRRGPGLNYPISRQLNRGDIVIQTNQAQQWAHVQLLDGTIGWINLSMFQTSSSSLFLPDLKLTKRGNLRFAPTTDSDVVILMEPPGIFKHIFQSGPWHAVITEDSTFGWVHDLIIEEIPNSGIILRVTTKSRIRSGPGTDYSIIKTVAPQNRLKPIAHIGGWYLIDLDSDHYGWIYQSLVDIIRPIQNVAVTIRTRTNGNVRSGPGLEYPIVNRVAKGVTFPVDKINHDWYHINSQVMTKGWIHKILVDTLFRKSEADYGPPIMPLDSIKTMIDLAGQAHVNQQYLESIQRYKMTLPLIKQAFQDNATDPCLRCYYAQNSYALSQDLNLDPGQTYEEAYHLLKSTDVDSACAGKVRDLIYTMEKAMAIRLDILSVFGNTDIAEKKIVEYGNNASRIFPFIIEAEIYRLIGRYFDSNRNDPQNAVKWQLKSVAIFQAALKNGIELSSLGLENYFYALMELGANQVHLGISAGYDYFDAAFKLIEKYDNNYWRNYYNRTLKSVSR